MRSKLAKQDDPSRNHMYSVSGLIRRYKNAFVFVRRHWVWSNSDYCQVRSVRPHVRRHRSIVGTIHLHLPTAAATSPCCCSAPAAAVVLPRLSRLEPTDTDPGAELPNLSRNATICCLNSPVHVGTMCAPVCGAAETAAAVINSSTPTQPEKKSSRSDLLHKPLGQMCSAATSDQTMGSTADPCVQQAAH